MKRKLQRRSARRLEGKGISPGIGYGIAYRIEPRHPEFYRIRIPKQDVEKELERLHKALEGSRRQYLSDKKKLEKAVGREHSYVIDAHLLMLEDREFLAELQGRIRNNLDSPEKALRHVGERLLAAYRSLEDPFFQERGSDFDEVIERVIANLTNLGPPADFDPPEDLVLVSSRVGLSLLARFPLERIKGLVLENVGRTSHVSIIARSYQIPVVSGIEDLREWIHTGDLVLIDGTRGIVEVGISPARRRKVQKELVDQATRSDPTRVGDRTPCVTADGQRLFLFANTEFGGEVEPALEFGAEGIGLFRSEYIYMKEKENEQIEERHFEVYRKLAETVGEKAAIVRTLDISQRTAEGLQAGEEGGVLGLRGIRLSLQTPDAFKSQVKAILRAKAYGNLKIILPMVSSVDEVLEGKRLIEEARVELGRSTGDDWPQIPVGVLLEVPAAVLALDSIAKHSDFLAVGTNDLIQYTLAAGRLNEEIAYLYNPFHPAILRSLRRVVDVALSRDLTALVCGEMVTNPVSAAILVGLGFRHLSMTSIAIPGIKRSLRKQSLSDLRAKVTDLLRLDSLADIDQFVAKNFEYEPGADYFVKEVVTY